MAPRKSDSTKATTVAGEESTSTPAKEGKESKEGREGINVEDLNLPKSIVTRLAKGVLPPNTQIQSNAMIALSKSATVFVNYLATHANEVAQAQNRKTISPADVFKTLEELQFGDFKPRLEAELQKFSDVQTNKGNTYRKKVAADKAAGTGEEAKSHNSNNRDGQPAAKKARRDTAGDVGMNMSEGQEDDMMMEEDTRGDEEQIVDDDETEEEEERERTEEEEQDVDGDKTEDEALDNSEDSD